MDFNKIAIFYLKSKEIKYFWYFTDIANLKNIQKYGIYSLADLKRKKVDKKSLSNSLDNKFRLDEFVHLSFIDDHPLFHIAKREGRIKTPVWIAIDINILLDKECYFSPNVVTKKNATLYSFKKISYMINFDKMFTGCFEARKKARHAEVLVRGSIEPKYILKYYCV